MLIYCTRILIALSLLTFGLTVFDPYDSIAQAEVIQPTKPVRPSYRIIEGKTVIVPENPAKQQNSDVARIWEIISDTRDIDVLDRFIAQFPGTAQAVLALNRRDVLVLKASGVKTDRGEPPTRNVISNQRPDLARLIQVELFRLGCKPGPSDGKWGRRSAEAAKRFSKYSRVVVETKYPNAALLAGVQVRDAGLCPAECGAKHDNVDGQCVAKTCRSGQKLSSRGVCYTPKVAKTCGPGQRLSSKGRCYTPKAAKTCRRGERLSSRGVCFKPKVVTKKKVTTSKKPIKPKSNRCSWCQTINGSEQYVCGARIARMRASGNCN